MGDALTDVERLDRAVTEKELQANVLDLARMLGWLGYHTHDSRRSAAGFPDLVLVRRSRVVFAELKRETGQVSPEQQTWIDALQRTDNLTFVWRPSDWRSGEIERVLR